MSWYLFPVEIYWYYASKSEFVVMLCTDKNAEDQEALCAQAMAIVLPYMPQYIWQKERFSLQSSMVQTPPWWQQHQRQRQRRGGRKDAKAGPGDEFPPCLWGSLCFGDNIEDEWFVVWLLLEITKKLAGTAVRVWDDDGDFLLIEAAYVLPKWLNPETVKNKVSNPQHISC